MSSGLLLKDGVIGRPSLCIADAILDHIVGPDRTLMHAFNLWITPEVRRREAAGLLTLPFGRDSLVLAMIPKRLVFLLAELNTPGGPCIPFSADLQAQAVGRFAYAFDSAV
jgi:hypothetical protein